MPIYSRAPDTLAPLFSVDVQGQPVPSGITQLIQKVEYESCDGMADVARITAINPEFKITDAKVFQAGNEMDIWMGYGREGMKHIGRVVITKTRPTWPESGIPTIQVVGYTKDAFMADNAPTVKKPPPKKPPRGRAYKDMRYSDAVKKVAESSEYNFDTDIDETPETPTTFIQKVGLSDYDFVKGLANVTGFMFWVEYNIGSSRWTLFFKNPNTYELQDKEYTFRYDYGDDSTLLSFTPELNIRGFQTKITAQIKVPGTGKMMTVEVEEESDKAPDMDATSQLTEDLKGDFTTASDVKLYFQDFCFDVIANLRIVSEAELKHWVKQWYRRQRENFIMATGKVIGIEELEARQVHTIEGVEGGYDGKYYFSRVKHIIDEGGYACEFNARKVVPK